LGVVVRGRLPGDNIEAVIGAADRLKFEHMLSKNQKTAIEFYLDQRCVPLEWLICACSKRLGAKDEIGLASGDGDFANLDVQSLVRGSPCERAGYYAQHTMVGNHTIPNIAIFSQTQPSRYVADNGPGYPLAAGSKNPAPRPKIQSAEELFQHDRDRGARYMEANCSLITLPGWEGFPTEKCHYPKDHPTAVVVLLDADPARLARWVADACMRAASSTPSCVAALFYQIHCQSGAQFPVAGTVIEDHSRFLFRDGVTVEMANLPGVTHGPNEDELLKRILTTPPTEIKKYARIQSSTRSDYRRAGGTIDVGNDDDVSNPAWLDVVRKSYQAAWNSDANDLMVAWVAGHPVELAKNIERYNMPRSQWCR
jgi:hypothetical protein